MTTTIIRKAEAADLEPLQELARRTIDACYRSFLTEEGVDWFIHGGESDREIAEYFGHCDVMVHDGAVAGCTIYFDDFVYLMMVDVRFHRRGLGSQLLAHAERELFARGNGVIRLETFEGNTSAVNFYLKHGWRVTGTKTNEEYGFPIVLFEKRAS